MKSNMKCRSLYYFFNNSSFRSHALNLPIFHPQRYCLYGYDELIKFGWILNNNLNNSKRRSAHIKTYAIRMALKSLGCPSGDIKSVLSNLSQANKSDIVFSTVDVLGIPLVFLKSIGILKPTLVYATIGLFERLPQLKNKTYFTKILHRLFHSVDRWISYGWSEYCQVKSCFFDNQSKNRLFFIPFGVNCEYFKPRKIDVMYDVVSIGGDVNRDFSSLVKFAFRNPSVRIKVITNDFLANRDFQVRPDNIDLLIDVPFNNLLYHFNSAKIVALPIHENSYSGATTTLLQAMSMEKAVVVSKVGAIEHGYDFADQINLLFSIPNDYCDFERALQSLLSDTCKADLIGKRAREHVNTNLRWDQFVKRLNDALICNF